MEKSKLKITNNESISLPFAVWLASDDYDYSQEENVISVTTLMKPVKQIVLGRRYKDVDKEIEVSNLIASSVGTALHDSVEKAWSNKEKACKVLTNMGYKKAEEIYDKIVFEKRNFKQFGEFKISGKFDLVFDGIVADIKSTSVWTFIYGSNDEDYKKQLSIYRVLNPELITNDAGYIEFIFTDWKKSDARAKSDYPQSRIQSKKIELMSIVETEKYITDKLELVKQAEELPDDKLPMCTEEELWATPDTWKYYAKRDAKRATKNFDNEKDAEARLTKDGGSGKVVKFEGEVKRCTYCNYTDLCGQYKTMCLMGRIKEQ